MPQIIDVPGQGQVEFPDGMDDNAIVSAIQRLSAPQQQAPNTAMMAANSANKGLAAIPDAILNTPNRLMNLGRAAFGTAATAAGRPDLAPDVKEDPNYTRQLFDRIGLTRPDLEPQTGGQRVLDTAIQGGVMAAVSPASSVRQMATSAAVGAGAGATSGGVREATGSDTAAMAAGLLAGPAMASGMNSARSRLAATELRRQQNSVRDRTISDARNSGYVLSPSETNPGVINQALEGVAGKLSTRQLASQRNQDVTNSLARQSIGIDDNVPLSPQLLQQTRRDAYQQGYAPVERAGNIRPGRLYRQALDDITSRYTGAASSFPAAVSDDVRRMVDALRVRDFDAGDALKMTQILRDDASKSFSGGNAGLGKAQRAAATAIEDQIERGLAGQGQNGDALLSGFRDARKLMAKTHTIEKALHEGSGNVTASKLAAELRKGRPLSGGLETIARTADTFPKNMQSPEVMGSVPGISPLDVLGGAGLGAMGAAATGNPTGALIGALPALRPVTRAALLSDRYQNTMGNPRYRNPLLARILAQGDLNNPAATNAMIAQMLAGQPVNQEN